jgi:hypothetical protein
MAGESNFFIFSRGKEEFSTDNAVCFLNKELDSNRKFINFAILETVPNNPLGFSLKILKKQEIPKQGKIKFHLENYIKNLDICQVRLKFIDNGDNKLYIIIENDTLKDQFFYEADFYIPISTMSNLMFGGNFI